MKGCFSLLMLFFWILIVLFLWMIICGISISISGSETGGMAIGTIGVVFAAIFVIIGQSSENKKIKKLENECVLKINDFLYKQKNFKPDDLYIVKNTGAFISVDEKNRLLLMGRYNYKDKNISKIVIEIKNVLSVDITEDGKGILSSSQNTNTLGMAAVGGLLFGGAGAVVGAISGSNNKSKVTELNLRLNINDIKTPYASLNFLPTTTDKDSILYKETFSLTEKWYGILSILSQRENKYTDIQIDKNKENESNSDIIYESKKLIHNESYIESINVLSNAIKRKIDLKNSYYLRAIAYSKLRNSKEALSDLQQAANYGNEIAIKKLEEFNSKNLKKTNNFS